MLVATEEILDSNTQNQVIQMMSRGIPEKTGAVHKDRYPPPKQRTYPNRALYVVCSLQHTKTTLMKQQLQTKFLFPLLGLSGRKSSYNSRVARPNRDFPPCLIYFYCLHTL